MLNTNMSTRSQVSTAEKQLTDIATGISCGKYPDLSVLQDTGVWLDNKKDSYSAEFQPSIQKRPGTHTRLMIIHQPADAPVRSPWEARLGSGS